MHYRGFVREGIVLYVTNRAAAADHRSLVVRLDCTIRSLLDGHILYQWKVRQEGVVTVDMPHCHPVLVVVVAACLSAQPSSRGVQQAGVVAYHQAV